MDLIIIFAFDGSIRWMSQSGLDLLSSAIDEVRGTDIFELPCWRDDDKPRLRQSIQSALAGEESPPELYRVSLPVGVRDFQVKTAPEAGEQGITGGIIIMRDASSEQAARYALQREQEFSSLVLETARALIIVMDRQASITRFNRMCEKVSGYRESEMTGKKLWEVLIPDKWAPVVKNLFSDIVSEQGRFDLHFENPWINRQGEQRWIVWNFSALRDEDGTISHLIATGIDVTELRRLEAEMQEHKKRMALSTMAGGIAHDFNNILTAVMGRAELLKLESSRGPELEKDIDDIIENARKGNDLVKKLLEFSRARPLQTSVVDVNHAVLESESLVSSILGEGVEVCMDLCDDPCQVEADHTQVQMIITNLAKNAGQAMPGGGAFTITTELDFSERMPVQATPGVSYKPCVRIKVADTGEGMEDEVRERIFEPYFTTRPGKESSGLGLAITHALVEQWGGCIHCESEPGKGTTFILELPRVFGSARPERKELPRGDEVILVIGAERTTTRLVSRMLTTLGYQVHVAESQAKALSVLESGLMPSLALIDSQLVETETNHLELKVSRAAPGCKLAYLVPLSWARELSPSSVKIQMPVKLEYLATRVREILDS